jgi:hypothetical protein
MTSSEVRDTTSTTALPRPRPAVDDEVLDEALADDLADELAATEAVAAPGTVARPEASHYPWPEPWRYSRAARPRTEFWDVKTASWRSRGPVSGTSGSGSSTTD